MTEHSGVTVIINKIALFSSVVEEVRNIDLTIAKLILRHCFWDENGSLIKTRKWLKEGIKFNGILFDNKGDRYYFDVNKVEQTFRLFDKYEKIYKKL